MSSWIPWAQATNPQFEELVEKACSPLNLPDTQDIPLQLEICDLVRSKTVPPRVAMLSLRARIAAKNPRVQLAAWQLADVCIKNGGDHFLREVAGREFVDECVGVIKAGGNPQVGERARALWQSWALAFEGRPELALVTDTYRQLKAEGITFPPPPPTIPSHLLTTSTPPTWLDSDACMRCRTPFSFTNRKHHCRACGLVFDQACSSRSMPLPHLGIPEPVRVCEACFAKRQQKTDAPAVPTKRTLRTGGKGYDADLQRAIALSLAESQQPSSAGYVPSQPGRLHEGTDAPGKPDDEDEELRLAIEASLDEMRRHAAPSAPPAGPSASADAPEYKPLPTYDLSPREAETVLSFAQTVDHACAFGDPDFRRFPHVHALHDQAAQVAGKLLRNIEEKNTKSQMLGEMQEQLVRAIKRYEEVLTEQDAYARRQAEQRRQQQPAYGYGYQPPEQGYQPHGQAYPYQAYAYYPQQPSGPGMYPSMPSAPGPETSNPYANYPPQHAPPADHYPPHGPHQSPAESSNPYAAQAYPQSSAPPLGSPPAAEYARYPGPEAQQQQQPPMASQAYPQSSAPPLGSPPAAEHARYPGMESQQQRQPLMSDQASAVAQQPTTTQSPPRGYSVPLHQPSQSHAPRQPQGYPHRQIPHDPPPAQAYQAAHATFPAFPDAPTQLPPSEPVVAEQPKEALLIEL